MGFLAPWFLAGIAAIGLPVYIHLLRRQTTIPKPVSSLMFFERGKQSSTKHRRLRYLLLFALRALLLLLLALAFANPFLWRAQAGSKSHLLIIVLDNSFSMKAGSRFADAKQAALHQLASKPSSQRAQIMALGGQLQVLNQPTDDPNILRAALDSIQPGDGHGNYGELGRGIRALADTNKSAVELGDFSHIDLHLFSDMQKSDMPANFADIVLPQNVSLLLHPAVTAANTALPNWTVESIVAPAQLADPKDPHQSHVEAVIAGYNTPAATRSVSLVVNGNAIATRTVNVPANGRATVEFHPLDVPYGFSRCEIRIDSTDNFPADNSGYFAVKRADPERVLFVHQSSDSRSPLYFGAALAAAAQSSFTLQSANADQTADIDPTKFAFVVLSDTVSLPSIFENSLISYVRNGGSVFIAAGTSAAHKVRIPVFAETTGEARFYSRDNTFATIGQTDFSHPALNTASADTSPANAATTDATAAKDVAGWSDIKFFYTTVLDSSPSAPTHSRVVARLADNTPLLLDKQLGDGHILLLTTGLDNLTNDLPIHPIFVTFVDHAARYLSGTDRLTGSRLVDSFVQLRNAAPAASQTAGSNIEIIDPDNKRPLSLAEASTIQSFQLTRAGFYQVRFANGKDTVLAVNPDRRESDLAVIPDDTLQLWSAAGSSNNQPAAAQSALDTGKNQQTSIWWFIMLLVFAVAVAETVLAGRYLGVQREEV
jgi:hypothetical protein